MSNIETIKKSLKSIELVGKSAKEVMEYIEFIEANYYKLQNLCSDLIMHKYSNEAKENFNIERLNIFNVVELYQRTERSNHDNSNTI